ncbi:hypothetical protein [Paenibacillus sp. HB172176]|uniref:glycan biosynthesis hexose transferase WsfD n=1 Tax=Paenibacillus sp. HB172176 TaxID=2493690 RepID=UPI001438A4B0|nr:hypothetical protein [Paenibacillus sp. HB172176]
MMMFLKKWMKPEWLFVVAGICVAISVLFKGSFVGVADNGDFLRIMGSAGLNYGVAGESYEDRFFGFSHIYFAYDHFFRGFYPTTQIILVAIARFIGRMVNPSAFDIRLLGGLYVLLFLAAGYLLIKFNKTRSFLANATLAVLMLIMLSDIGYLAYFNSLFGEPVSYVFLLLAMGLGLMLTRQKLPARSGLLLFFLAVLFLACSKTQNAPIGIGFALILLRFAWLKQGAGGWKRLALLLSGLMCLFSIIMYAAAPQDFKKINLYQTVFFGVLNGSPDVEGDLDELGLPERLSVLAGTNYFQSGTAIAQNDPSLEDDFYSRISHGKVMLFYMKHPARFLNKMEFAAENGMTIRPYYLGNYAKEEGEERGALSYAFSGWSEFKKHHMPNRLWFIGLVYLLYIGVLVFYWAKDRDTGARIRVELFLLLALTGMFSFLIPILGDGQADIAKHLFLFNAVFDMMLITGVVWLVHRIAVMFRRRGQEQS